MAGDCECGNEHLDSMQWGNCVTSLEPVCFSRRALLHGVSKLGIVTKKCRVLASSPGTLFIAIFIKILSAAI